MGAFKPLFQLTDPAGVRAGSSSPSFFGRGRSAANMTTAEQTCTAARARLLSTFARVDHLPSSSCTRTLTAALPATQFSPFDLALLAWVRDGAPAPQGARAGRRARSERPSLDALHACCCCAAARAGVIALPAVARAKV